MSIYTIIHFSLMGIAALLLLAAIFTARKKNDPAWLNKHRIRAVSGVIAGIAGALVMFFHKEAASYPHFKSLHAIAGLVTVLLILITPTMGMILVRGKETLRPVHRLFGRITFLIVVITALFGVLRLLQLMKIIQ